ncbi:MAG TPA: amino acid adenylation domain-containing protein, partial [Thermoanaerobaculia bacterium]|nr:amino acid adenylation domain-containing protein [Thermoanaerobaculia bacterium]
TPTEELVAAVWSEILGVPSIGRTANFFELGGHSLAATQVALRLGEAAGVEVPVQAVFQAQTVAALAEALEAALASGRAASAAASQRLVPVPRDGDIPLSFAQERLWFIDRLVPGTPAYNMPLPLRIEGDLPVARLRAAFAAIAGRHEALRTTFGDREGRPVQRVAPVPEDWPLPLVDLSGLSPEAREAEALRLARLDGVRSFDLAHGPVFTTSLLRLDSATHVLLLNVHHIAADAWSMGVLVDDMAALAAGRQLPALPIQYPDYAVWQRSWLNGEELERQLAFWRERLAGAPAVLELPTDRPRPPVQTLRGGSFDLLLPADLAREVGALSQRQEATPYMVLLAAWGVLMARLAGQPDLVVGTAIANRERPELERLIGFFVNTLAMRIDLTDDPSFAELAARTRRFALDAFAHRDLPLEKLIEAMQLGRDRSRQPLIQSVFNLQNAPVGRIEVPGLTLTPLLLAGETSKFDLTLTLSGDGEQLNGRLEYAADLFEPSTTERWMRHFETLLAGIVEAPGRPVSELPLLSAAERRQLVADWNRTAAEYPREATVDGLFWEQARRTPGAVALVHGDEELTYADLAGRAGRLARRLRGLGVGPEVRVALWSERSPSLIAALLGILRAGGAYVPLDPTHPAERLAFQLADAGARVLLGERRTLEQLPAESLPPGLQLASLDDPEESDGDEVEPGTGAGNLAYVLYTSGSTGEPKGVAVTHRNVVRLVRGADYARFGPEQTFLQFAPVSFDASTLEIWGPLLNGGRLALFPGQRASLEDLAGAVARQGVTSLWLTAGLFHQMVDHQLDGLRSLTQLLAGGDVVSPAHARRALEVLPGLTLINGYGPTEGTTFTCCHAMTVPAAIGDTVPIGQPISNTRAYVLDSGLRPVPVGVWGELYAGGDGVARGYLDRPDLTAERFVPDPFVEEPGGRLYRTGDLVRWRLDGTLEFLGRRDGQVKVRGFRIELGEIEAALAAHPGVRQAVAVLRRDRDADPRLVAYVTGSARASELRPFLLGRLPEPMVPSDFVTLDSLPLTPNGKVDRRALPAPDRAGAAEEAFVPPSTPLESRLAEICAEVLGVERIGMRDNFFALGGHSLLATQLVARLRERHGIEVSLEAVFDAADIGELADRIMDQELAEAGDEVLADMLREMEDLSPEELQELLGRPAGPVGPEGSSH